MRWVKLAAAFLSLAILAHAPAAAKTAVAKASPPLYRVTDADSEFYLLGTFHILPPGFDWRSREAGAAIDAADAIWFEAEVDTRAAQQKTLQILQSKGFNPPGKPLSAMLGAEDADRLSAVAAELNLPMTAIDPMRPWQAFLVLSVQFIVSQGFDPGSGVEAALLAEGRARGRSLRFLETVEQQLGLFTDLAPATEKELLVLTLRDWEKQKADFDPLFEAWKKGDVEAIDALMNAPMRAAAPHVYEVLLTKRNAAWTEEIAKAIASGRGKAVVAVGAGHLAGPHSVPAMLEAKGFSVTKVEPAPAKN